jgi:hypothetical protein
VSFESVEVVAYHPTSPHGYTRVHFRFAPSITDAEVDERFHRWPVRISDDIGTEYTYMGGGSAAQGGESTRAMREFSPGIPKGAGRLTIELTTTSGRSAQHEADLGPRPGAQ